MYVQAFILVTTFSLVFVTVQSQADQCARRGRFDCLPDVYDKSNCPSVCNKCPSNYPRVRQCSTAHRACIFDNRHVLTAYTTKATCEQGPGRVWCGGDSLQQCVETYPILEQCFKRINLLTPCASHSTMQSCNLNGCFWCYVGTAGSVNRCFTRDAEDECGGEKCCVQQTCLPGSVSENDCENRGCKICNDGTRDRCNFAGNGTDDVDEAGWSKCDRKCGGGTQIRTTCTDGLDATCVTIARSCNIEPCVLPVGYCDYGVRARYNDLTMCCNNHTKACGINSLNDNDYASCGSRKKRVVGGIESTDEKKWPWIAVVYVNISNPAFSRKCSATVVGNKCLVTSPECLMGASEDDSIAHIATPDRRMSPKSRSHVTNFQTLSDKVAVVELSSTIDTEGLHISPICLPNTEEAYADRRCVVTGWGSTGPNTSCTATLQEGNVRVLPWELCENAWKEDLEGVDPDTMICAGIPEGEPDACVGDEGGPLMCQRCVNCGWYLAGIATTMVGCGTNGKPSVYAKITNELQTQLHQVASCPSLDSVSYPSCNPH